MNCMMFSSNDITSSGHTNYRPSNAAAIRIISILYPKEIIPGKIVPIFFGRIVLAADRSNITFWQPVRQMEIKHILLRKLGTAFSSQTGTEILKVLIRQIR